MLFLVIIKWLCGGKHPFLSRIEHRGQSNALKSILIGWKAVGCGEMLFKMYRASWLDKKHDDAQLNE